MASIGQIDDEPILLADSAVRPTFNLTMPRGHTLMLRLTGQARWSQGAEGTIGFYLLVQHWTDQQWATIGSDGTSGMRTGPAEPQGRAIVPVALNDTGLQRLRAIVWTVVSCESGLPPSQYEADDVAVVEIGVDVLPGSVPTSGAVERPPAPSGEGWLAPDPSMLKDIPL
jgi:hypothetical protein